MLIGYRLQIRHQNVDIQAELFHHPRLQCDMLCHESPLLSGWIATPMITGVVLFFSYPSLTLEKPCAVAMPVDNGSDFKV